MVNVGAVPQKLGVCGHTSIWPFSLFGVGNSHLKFVPAFKIHRVYK
jgi:hypothetical protein